MAISSYLLWGLLLSGLGLAVLPFLRPHGRVALLSGIFAAPLGLLDIVFVPEYWAPFHIFGSGFSVEGILFSFSNGILMWPIAVMPFWKRLTYKLNFWDMISRCLICWSLSAAIILLVWKRGANLLGTDIMTSALLALAGCGVFILWRRPDLWRLMISGVLGFGTLYYTQLAIVSMIDPGFADVWSPYVSIGQTIFGFPVEELVWALIYGGVWAAAVAFGCNAKFSDRQVG